MADGRAAAYCLREHWLWHRVLQRRWSVGPNGQGTRPSEYSCLVCLECRRQWRTKAAYVDLRRDINPQERAELRERRTG
jgi:hypothetical protein